MDYAITFTLNPHMYKLMPEDQADMAVAMIKTVFPEELYKKTLVLELTKSFNVHVHGIMYSKTKREIYDRLRKNKILGFITVKQIENWSDWVDYITKDTIVTYKQLNCRHPVPVNDHQIPFRLYFEEPNTQPVDEFSIDFSKIQYQSIQEAMRSR